MSEYQATKGLPLTNLVRKNINRKDSFLLVTIMFFIALFFSVSSHAQNLDNEDKIIEFLGMEKYSSLVQKNPSYLNFLDARYSHGYHMMDYVEEKMSEFEVMDIIYHTEWAQVDINGKSCNEIVKTKLSPEKFLLAMESEEFNFLEYTFTFDRSKITYHVLGTTGKVIMILPVEQINKIVNKEK